jgi:hypothetical protein
MLYNCLYIKYLPLYTRILSYLILQFALRDMLLYGALHRTGAFLYTPDYGLPKHNIFVFKTLNNNNTNIIDYDNMY